MDTNRVNWYPAFGNTTHGPYNSHRCWQLWSKIPWWGTCQSSQTSSGRTLQTHLWLNGYTLHWHYIRLELLNTSGSFVNAKIRDKRIKTIPTHCQKQQYAPYPCILIQYGPKKQYATQELKAPLRLADKVANMSATCRPDSQMSALLAKMPCRGDTILIPTHFFVSGFANIHQIFLFSTRGTYGEFRCKFLYVGYGWGSREILLVSDNAKKIRLSHDEKYRIDRGLRTNGF
jgi:hypothetical protein